MRRPSRLVPTRPAQVAASARGELGGAPLVLPPWLDALSDRWWGLPPRARVSATLLLVLALLAASTLRVVASPYGPPVPVLVAAEDLPAGTELDRAVVHTARWPGELAPSGARSEPTGTLTAPLPAGAVLTDGHVTDRGLGGLVGPGRAAVPLPAELVPRLEVGAVAQVVASAPDGAGVVLADHAEVVALDGGSLWLAVPVAAAADVAAAGLRGTVALAVVTVDGGADP